jgi:hypothetical protein
MLAAGCSGDPDLYADCSAYASNGETYNCEQLDRCNETDFNYLLACCNCDPAIYCRQDPSCIDTPPPPPPPPGQPLISSCMDCHNGAASGEDYSGPGITNPHPFEPANYLSCIQCHGGNPNGQTKIEAHVARPPVDIGDDLQLQNNAESYFNFLTLAGADKFDDYTGPGGEQYSALDWLQFMAPSDIRVVSQARGCGQIGCHGDDHGKWVERSVLATETGFYSATLFTSGVGNYYPERANWYSNTAADYAIRDVEDPDFTYTGNEIGRVGSLKEYPEYAQFGTGLIYQSAAYDANQLPNLVYADNNQTNLGYANSIMDGTVLDHLVKEIVAITCGDCHLTHRGANNRYADFRPSGCASCHMQYSVDGRSRTRDPNTEKLEPANPDAIAAPERSHPSDHQIRNVAKILPGGGFLRGVDDYACVGCHQGSNRTVLQFWGIRLDQNKDLVNQFQYPQNPVTFVNTADDQRLFNPGVNNNTFNGRDADQYILEEDYDGDGRDDTPEDLHHAAGMGCIDCHGERDLHGGTEGDPTSGQLLSREDQFVKIRCESCHGGPDDINGAPTVPCVNYVGQNTECAVDLAGNPLRNVEKDPNGDLWLTSRLTGNKHYVVQTYDTIIQTNKSNPQTGQLVWTPEASYAMGTADGNNNTGIGPMQQNIQTNFSHLKGAVKLECSACHSAWANNCIGCHLAPGYDANPANYFFSNTTGERIVLFQAAADFVYITTLPFNIGVGSRNEIASTAPGMKMFFRYDTDLNGNESQVLAFTDRVGNGNNPAYQGRGAFGSLAHNKIAPHSMRGAVDGNNEGPRYCAACHITEAGFAEFGADYTNFYNDYINRNYANFDFNLLQQHIGENPNNYLESPYFTHMVAGRGSGLFLFDAQGCPVNPLDANPNRFYCDDAPANLFDLNNVVYDLDAMVEVTGAENMSSAHPMLNGQASALRVGANTPQLAGPLGRTMLERLTSPDPNLGLHLDSWIDSDGNAQGNAANFGL